MGNAENAPLETEWEDELPIEAASENQDGRGTECELNALVGECAP